jgi:hypothetical protein
MMRTCLVLLVVHVQHIHFIHFGTTCIVGLGKKRREEEREAGRAWEGCGCVLKEMGIDGGRWCELR